MKKIVFLISFIFLMSFSNISSAIDIRPYNCLTGGTTGCLDKTDGDNLSDGDLAIVLQTSTFSCYYLDDDSAASENSPEIIAPDTNPGDKRWIRIYTSEHVFDDLDLLFGTDSDAKLVWDSSDARLEIRDSSNNIIGWFDIVNKTINMAAVASPEVSLYDSDAAGSVRTDEYSGGIGANQTTVTEDGVYATWIAYSVLNSSKINFIEWDSEGEDLTLGDSNTGEDLVIDFDTGTSNEIKFSSNSSVLNLNFSNLNLLTGGTFSGRIPIGTDISSNISLNTQDLRGYFYLVTAACTVTLDSASDAGYGAAVIFYIRDSSETFTIEIDGSNKINLHGTALTAGNTIDSPGNAGDFICLIAVTDTDGSGTDGWLTLGYGKAVWTDGGAT